MDDAKKAELLRKLDEADGETNLWQAGEAIGLDRGDTESLSFELMADGLVEIVSLSGGVRITDLGRQSLGAAVPAGGSDSLEAWLAELAAAGDLGLSGPAAADLAADAAALSAQLQRSQPLAQVRQALLEALAATLENASAPSAADLAARARALAQP